MCLKDRKLLHRSHHSDRGSSPLAPNEMKLIPSQQRLLWMAIHNVQASGRIFNLSYKSTLQKRVSDWDSARNCSSLPVSGLWGSWHIRKTNSMTELNYLSPPQKAWVKLFLWLSVCWLSCIVSGKRKIRISSLSPRIYSKCPSLIQHERNDVPSNSVVPLGLLILTEAISILLPQPSAAIALWREKEQAYFKYK